MNRRKASLLVGLVLLLVASGVGWLAQRGERAPGATGEPGGSPQGGSSAPGTVSPGPGLARAQDVEGIPVVEGAPTDPAHARCFAAWQRIERERLAQLASEPQAASQLAAAMLENTYTPDIAANEAAKLRRHRRLQWALELAPQDPVVAAHAHRFCMADNGCDASRSLDHLMRVDPDNAWTWIAVLQRAQAAGDAAVIERTLERVAGSRVARSHYGAAALRLVEAFGEAELPPGCARRMIQGTGVDRPVTTSDLIDLAIGTRALGMLPSVHPLIVACRGDVPDAHRRALCIRALATFADGEFVVDRRLVTSLLAQLTAGTADGAAWRERYRNLEWLLAQMQSRRLFEQASPLEWWQRGEVPFLEEELRAAGAWPAPPGWLPESEEARALVLTGRRPPPR